jgi:hypothetical protein
LTPSSGAQLREAAAASSRPRGRRARDRDDGRKALEFGFGARWRGAAGKIATSDACVEREMGGEGGQIHALPRLVQRRKSILS